MGGKVQTCRSLWTWFPIKVPPWYACLLTLSSFRLASKERKNGPSFGLNFLHNLSSREESSADYNSTCTCSQGALCSYQLSPIYHILCYKLPGERRPSWQQQVVVDELLWCQDGDHSSKDKVLDWLSTTGSTCGSSHNRWCSHMPVVRVSPEQPSRSDKTGRWTLPFSGKQGDRDQGTVMVLLSLQGALGWWWWHQTSCLCFLYIYDFDRHPWLMSKSDHRPVRYM